MKSERDAVYDVAVIGLGAMGSAALCHLASRGATVLGIDQFDPPHTSGSSHGETRVIREAYFEHPCYVPLVQRAYELWEKLEAESGQKLYLKTGGLMLGASGSTVFEGAVQSARLHWLEHEILDSHSIGKRIPALTPDAEIFGVLEPRAGILFAEKCVSAHLKLAVNRGATVLTNTRVREWKETSDEISVYTEQGEFKARKLIISAGAWVPNLFPELRQLFTVERQVLLWFQAEDPALFTPDRFPIHLWEYEKDRMFYGFPDLGSGVKVAFHHQGVLANPEAVNRDITGNDIESMRKLLARYLPKANGEFLRGTVCLYTNTPDGHFILDRHSQSDRVIVASPCSGHGFKFASAIGEVLAGMAMDEKPKCDLSLFELRRFTQV